MNSVTKGILFGLLVLAANLANGSEIGPEYNLDIPKSEAKPVVKVHPKAPTAKVRKLPACIVVSFELSEKPDSNGKGLIPTAIKTELSTEKKWNKPVEKAVSKWLYLAKNVEFRGRQYYEFSFEAQNP